MAGHGADYKVYGFPWRAEERKPSGTLGGAEAFIKTAPLIESVAIRSKLYPRKATLAVAADSCRSFFTLSAEAQDAMLGGCKRLFTET